MCEAALQEDERPKQAYQTYARERPRSLNSVTKAFLQGASFFFYLNPVFPFPRIRLTRAKYQ